MKTWKKIEETKKRTNDITGLKKRNEEKVQKVSEYLNFWLVWCSENIRYSNGEWAKKANELKQLYAFQIKLRWKKESLRCPSFAKKGRSEASQNDKALKWIKETPKLLQIGTRKQNEKSNWTSK